MRKQKNKSDLVVEILFGKSKDMKVDKQIRSLIDKWESRGLYFT